MGGLVEELSVLNREQEISDENLGVLPWLPEGGHQFHMFKGFSQDFDRLKTYLITVMIRPHISWWVFLCQEKDSIILYGVRYQGWIDSSGD